MRSVPLVLLCAIACRGDEAQPPLRDPIGPEPPSAPEPKREPPSPFPASTLSLRLKRTVGVRLLPFEAAKRIGTIAIDTRVGWNRTERGEGCSSVWVEIHPRGWVCADHLEPSIELPRGAELPRLDRAERVPGIYGKVVEQGAITMMLDTGKPVSKGRTGKPAIAGRSVPVTSPSQLENDRPAAPTGRMVAGRPMVGSVNVRQYKELILGGRKYWKISPTENEYLLASAIRQHTPSEYQGVRLGDDTQRIPPIAFLWPRSGGLTVWSRETAKSGAKRMLPRRTLVSVLETASDPTGKPIAYRIGPAEWVDVSAVRMFNQAPPPPLLQPQERWIDIDLDAQILVAFEGDLPVYATMMSAGTKQTPTETGVYRMWKKMAETDMNGLTGEDPYSVATVPWTQFFSPEKGLALHTSYWHDGFGTARSHGCVNLAPADARWLYFWSDPQVPPGWTMAAGVTEEPGSIVRVRSKMVPDPEVRGYAKKVDEVRSSGEPLSE